MTGFFDAGKFTQGLLEHYVMGFIPGRMDDDKFYRDAASALIADWRSVRESVVAAYRAAHDGAEVSDVDALGWAIAEAMDMWDQL